MSSHPSAPIEIPGNIITLYSQVTGPKDTKTLKMIVDTGASYTMIPVTKALEIGHDPTVPEKRIRIFTASGIEYVPLVRIVSFKCMGIAVNDFLVICHDLPPDSPADGLLGLNFLTYLPSFREFFKSLKG